MDYQHEIKAIKKWLGAGSINIFGLPYSGKDTVGLTLASGLDAEFISSGQLLRRVQEKDQSEGFMSPTNVFKDVVLPVFHNENYANKPLILSSVGRWHGEEQSVIETTKNSGHPLKVVLYIEINEDEIYRRMNMAYNLGDRSGRLDDNKEIIQVRLAEFKEKTLPVIENYRNMGLLIDINGIGEREKIMERVIKKLYSFTKTEKTS